MPMTTAMMYQKSRASAIFPVWKTFVPMLMPSMAAVGGSWPLRSRLCDGFLVIAIVPKWRQEAARRYRDVYPVNVRAFRQELPTADGMGIGEDG